MQFINACGNRDRYGEFSNAVEISASPVEKTGSPARSERVSASRVVHPAPTPRRIESVQQLLELVAPPVEVEAGLDAALCVQSVQHE